MQYGLCQILKSSVKSGLVYGFTFFFVFFQRSHKTFLTIFNFLLSHKMLIGNQIIESTSNLRVALFFSLFIGIVQFVFILSKTSLIFLFFALILSFLFYLERQKIFYLINSLSSLFDSDESFFVVFFEGKVFFKTGNLKVSKNSFDDLNSFQQSLLSKDLSDFVNNSILKEDYKGSKNFMITPFRVTSWILKSKNFFVILFSKFNDENNHVFNSFTKMMQNLSDGIIIANTVGKIEFFNQNAELFLKTKLAGLNVKSVNFLQENIIVSKTFFETFVMYKIQESSSVLKELSDNSPFAKGVFDKDLKILYGNKEFLKCCEVENHVSKLVVEEQEELFKEYIANAISKKTVSVGNFVFRINEEVFTVYVKSIAEDKVGIYFFSDPVLNEITCKFLHEQRLYALGEIIGSISHDFNNIVTTILTILDLFFDRNQLNELSEDYLDLSRIKHSAEKGAELIKQVLTLARKETPKSHKKVEIVKVLSDFSATIGRILSEKIKFSFERKESKLFVLISEVMIEQIVTNLIVNARDAINGNGEIKILLEKAIIDESKDLNGFYVLKGEYAKITVSDTGIGIPEENLEKIFNLFFTTKQEKGNGFGLATVKSIVQKHSGFIDVKSKQNIGSDFMIYLPICKEDSKDIKILSSKDENSNLIAIVDDEKSIATFLKKGLEKKGFNVISSFTGEEILQNPLLKEARLLITDLTLPTMSGEDLAKEALKINPEIKIVFMSGYIDIDKERMSLADHFIQKPFGIADIDLIIRKVIS